MEELDPQALQFKEVCAYYGAAMHGAGAGAWDSERSVLSRFPTS